MRTIYSIFVTIIIVLTYYFFGIPRQEAVNALAIVGFIIAYAAYLK